MVSITGSLFRLKCRAKHYCFGGRVLRKTISEHRCSVMCVCVCLCASRLRICCHEKRGTQPLNRNISLVLRYLFRLHRLAMTPSHVHTLTNTHAHIEQFNLRVVLTFLYISFFFTVQWTEADSFFSWNKPPPSTSAE